MSALKIHARTWSILACCVVALGGGCGDGDDDGGASATTTVYGIAMLSRPLAGAEVALYDEAGDLLTPVPAITGEQGTFIAEVPGSMPSRFRATVTGGSCDTSVFDDMLVQDVDGFDPDEDVLHVNAVTTLAALHRDRNPRIEVKSAESDVHGFLELPQKSEGACGVTASDESLFSHEELFAGISQGGGACPTLPNGHFTTYLHGLLDEMDRGVQRHAFREEFGGAGEVISELAEKLAEGIAEEGAGEVFGFIFDKILTGLGLNEEVNLLNEVLSKLEKIEVELEKLEEDAKDTELEVLLSGMGPLVSDTKDKFCLLTKKALFYKDHPCTPGSCGDVEISTAITEIVENHSRLQALHDYLVPSDIDRKGVLGRTDDWFKVTKNRRFYSDTVDPTLEQLFEHYEAAQLMWTTLYIEAIHVSDKVNGNRDAGDYLDLYNGLVDNEREHLSTLHAPTGTIIDLNTGLMWAKQVDSYVDTGDFFQPTEDKDLVDFGEFWCRNHVSAGEFTDWRLPKDTEFDDLIMGREGTSNFDWFESQGFTGFAREVFEGGRSCPYYSSGYWGGNRLTDFAYAFEETNDGDPHGVDWFCRWKSNTAGYIGSYCDWYSGRTPTCIGMWCVRDQTGEEGGGD